MASLKKLLRNPAKVVYILDKLGISKWIPDRPYLKLKYRANFGKKLDLENPQTFNEKLQWLKLYDRKPEYTAMVDKYEAKRYVAERIGEEYIIPNLGIWDRVEDIDFDALPEQFVLKCTHDSGGIVICKDKSALDVEKTKRTLKKWLNRDFYQIGREWPYKGITPRIIGEKYIENETCGELVDYKILCFGGQPELIQIHRGRFGAHTQDFYDTAWKKLNIDQGVPQSKYVEEKPEFMEEILSLSAKLAMDVPELRVDWYYVRGQLYFGELTFFDGCGFEPFEPELWDYTFGSWIKLPE